MAARKHLDRTKARQYREKAVAAMDEPNSAMIARSATRGRRWENRISNWRGNWKHDSRVLRNEIAAARTTAEPRQRVADYMARAAEADKEAAKCRDDVARENWKSVADAYRKLARCLIRNLKSPARGVWFASLVMA